MVSFAPLRSLIAWFRSLDPRIQALVVAPAIGFSGILAAGVIVLVVLIALSLVGYQPSPLVLIGLSLVLVQGISFGGVASIYLIRTGRSPLSLFRVPTLRDVAVAVGGFFGSLAILIAASAAVQQAGAPTAENEVAQIGAENPEVLLLLIPAAFVFIGPGEEILFRGVVQDRLREAFSPWVAIPLASVIFGAVHYVALTGAAPGRIVTIGILSTLTLVFGATYEYTDNLVVPSFIHGAYDAVLFAGLYVVVVYGPEAGSPEQAATMAFADLLWAVPLV
ncbi:CPBP family intramembrane glutamic endopeptidase [Halobaculum magnesiiphilum]|uniref:CPBP family intramembrane metalloprotease n=1 Tax=Halobaculum magnesiiphilum TaxID=1017351 RepID=A0A8T8WGH1_9EURY|nr:type II CAAX endopeptidase family protein [Halobaculum magnesiiphilum]QZP38947.1 CPBP family intramembrane metalloprotease [Halobaculum magnesiiphilum]